MAESPRLVDIEAVRSIVMSIVVVEGHCLHCDSPDDSFPLRECGIEL